ncbi:uncharacterized protein LOC111929581 [Cyanistes caeruleus]|uniref:uncharacterized protein LOC111929581 n=1 Tax=Cyanistes caeruleus TaxID=156563 RepID=UPI000CDB32B6|nr:uncharacterized protein LOC111929581 [Cyanistes caeruleus]
MPSLSGEKRGRVLGTAKSLLPCALWFVAPTVRWRDDFDELVVSNNDVVFRNIAEDLRNRLPIEAMFTSEHQAVQKIHQHPLPMIHVDAFLYDDDVVDSLCEEGKMSRSYCTQCGSYKTASLEFISHSFSLMELKFLYQHVLPDLTGKVVVDVGSRLGAVLFAGYLYSSASLLYGVEMNADFCQLQEMMITFLTTMCKVQDPVFAFAELQKVPLCPSLHGVSHTSQLPVISEVAEEASALHPGHSWIN